MSDPNQNLDPNAAGHEDTWGATPAFKAAWADTHPPQESPGAEELPAPTQAGGAPAQAQAPQTPKSPNT